MTRPLFGSRILQVLPPWLQRTTGGRVMGALGDVLDVHTQRAFEALTLRFPRSTETTALPYLGRDRRIRRGPAEPASSYARRLLTWWADHKQRGGPHALLRQIHAYLLDYAPGQIDLVYQSGTRFPCDETTSEITRSDITWGGDGHFASDPYTLGFDATATDTTLRVNGAGAWPLEGRYQITISRPGVSETAWVTTVEPGAFPPVVHLESPIANSYPDDVTTVVRDFANWARIWLFVHINLVADVLLTEGADELLTEAGDGLEGDVPVFGGTFGPDDEATWAAVPREWSAAHIQRVTIVLLTGAARCWGYPVPVPTWGDWGATSTWGTSSPATVIIIED